MPINKAQLDRVINAFVAMRDKGLQEVKAKPTTPLEVTPSESETAKGKQPARPMATPTTTK